MSSYDRNIIPVELIGKERAREQICTKYQSIHI